MRTPLISISSPDVFDLAVAGQSAMDVWYTAAEADYALCRRFADTFDAKLSRSLRAQRVGWERDQKPVYGILIPDPLPAANIGGDWYLYYVWGETLFRRTAKERAQRKMLVLPEAADDWAELLRQALSAEVFDVCYAVAPHHVNALGDYEHQPTGYEFTLTAHSPQSAPATSALLVSGTGPTPEAAARDAARRWLERTDKYGIAG